MPASEAARPLTDVQHSPHDDPRVSQLAPIAISQFRNDLELPVRDYWGEMRSVLDQSHAPDAEEQVLDREVMFCSEVYGAVEAVAASHDGPITLLFDVDQTMVEQKEERRDGKRVVVDVVRPGVSAVSEKILRNRALRDRVGEGVITSRPADDWNGPNRAAYVKAFSGLGEEEFYISTGDMQRNDERMKYLSRRSTTEEKLEAVRDILDPKVVEKAASGELGPSEWFDIRMVQLSEMLKDERYADHAFVYVDDLPFAKALRKDNPRLKGVCVSEEVQDELRRTVLLQRAADQQMNGAWN